MKAKEIYLKIKNEITEGIYSYDDQIVAISKWVEKEFKPKNKNTTKTIEEEETKDLFEFYEEQPDNVKSILAHYGDEALTYEELAGLQKNLETIGYTFDYGLDAQPYNLRKI